MKPFKLLTFNAVFGFSLVFSNLVWSYTSPDPGIKRVSTSDVTAANGDFFRVVLLNSEIDSCLWLEKINLLNGPKVITSWRVCKFSDGSSIKSLAADKIQDAEISRVKWSHNKLCFDLLYNEALAGASTTNYHCVVTAPNGTEALPQMNCMRP